MSIEAQRGPIGAIAAARITGGHATPADGFAIDLARLDLLTRELLEQAEAEGWSVDLSPDSAE